jgi:hypothetical protein
MSSGSKKRKTTSLEPINENTPVERITLRALAEGIRESKKATKQALKEERERVAREIAAREKRKNEWIRSQMPELLIYEKGVTARERAPFRIKYNELEKKYKDPENIGTVTIFNNNNNNNDVGSKNTGTSTFFAGIKKAAGRGTSPAGKKKAAIPRGVYEKEPDVIKQCKGGFDIDPKTGKLDYSKFRCWLCGFPIGAITNRFKVKADGTTPAPSDDYSLFSQEMQKSKYVDDQADLELFMKDIRIKFQDRAKVNGETLLLITCEHVLPIKLTPYLAPLFYKGQGSLDESTKRRQKLAYKWACRFCNYIKNHRHFITLAKGSKNAFGIEVNPSKIDSFLERLYNNQHGASQVEITFADGKVVYPNHVQAQLGILEHYYKSKGIAKTNAEIKAEIKAEWKARTAAAIAQRQQLNVDQIKRDEEVDFTKSTADIMSSLDPNVQEIVKEPRVTMRLFIFEIAKKLYDKGYTPEKIGEALKPIPGVLLNGLLKSIIESRLVPLTELMMKSEPTTCVTSSSGLPASSECNAYYTSVIQASERVKEELADAEILGNNFVDLPESTQEQVISAAGLDIQFLNRAEKGDDTYLEPSQAAEAEEYTVPASASASAASESNLPRRGGSRRRRTRKLKKRRSNR